MAGRPAPFDTALEEALIDYPLWRAKNVRDNEQFAHEEVLKLVERIDVLMPTVSIAVLTLRHMRSLLGAELGIASDTLERSFKESRRAVLKQNGRP